MGENFSKEILEKYVLQMIADKGAGLNDDDKEEEKDRLLYELNKKVNEAVVGALPEEKANKLEQMIDEKGDDLSENEVVAVVYGSQDEINEAVRKVMDEFRENYLNGNV